MPPLAVYLVGSLGGGGRPRPADKAAWQLSFCRFYWSGSLSRGRGQDVICGM